MDGGWMKEGAPINKQLLQKEMKIISASKAKKQNFGNKDERDKNYQTALIQGTLFHCVFLCHVVCHIVCHIVCVT